MSPPLRRLLATVFVAALSARLAPAQPQTKPGDQLMDKYLAARAEFLGRRPFNGLLERGQWEAQRPRLVQEYLDMLGLWPLPEKTPLHATVTGTLERDGVVIEKLHFQSRPGLYVTGNLFRPKDAAGRLPTILYVCGHSGRGRDGNKVAFQDHGLWFATHGYVCLIIDTLQLGEIPGIHHGTYREGRWWWQAAGYTPAGVECWNGVRALDYLVSRPDVDPERLGVTGISGGGAATFWIAAADERVKCAVPVSGMSDLQSYVTNKVVNGHCDCMFLINAHRWEWTTIAGLVAPRPMLFANSDNDSIFPMDGNRRIVDRLRQLYQLYGKPELVDEYVSQGGHAYRPDLRLAVFQWINKHLKNDTGPVKDAEFKETPGKELRVFPEDKDVPRDALNGKIDETFVPRAKVSLPASGGFEAWRKDLLTRVRQRSFAEFPETIPALSLKSASGSLDVWLTQTEQGGRRFLERASTEPGIEVAADMPNAPALSNGRQTLVVLGPGDGNGLPSWAQAFVQSKDAGLLWPRGVRTTTWTPKSPPNYVERAHALLGRTVDQGRVWDVAATVRQFGATKQDRLEWRVIGRGPTGVVAAYAALFEPSIAEVVLVDPPASHREGPIFLNILRVVDVPEALGLLAPRPLTLVNAKDGAFDRTAAIYRAAGAEEKLQRK